MNANTCEEYYYEEKERKAITQHLARILADSTAGAIRHALELDDEDTYQAAISIELDNYLVASYFNCKQQYFAELKRRNINPDAVLREPFRFPAVA